MSTNQTHAQRLATLRLATHKAMAKSDAYMLVGDGTREERAARAHTILVAGLRAALLCEVEGAETVEVGGVKIPVVGVVGDGGKVEWSPSSLGILGGRP